AGQQELLTRPEPPSAHGTRCRAQSDPTSEKVPSVSGTAEAPGTASAAAPAGPRCTDTTTHLLYPHSAVVWAVAAAPPASRGAAPPPGPTPPPGRPGEQRERLSGEAAPSVGPSGWASLPATAAARARPCRAPPLLPWRRRAAPGASPLGLHRRLPPPPPLSPPLLRRRLHGARPYRKCRRFRPASTSGRGSSARALLRLRGAARGGVAIAMVTGVTGPRPPWRRRRSRCCGTARPSWCPGEETGPPRREWQEAHKLWVQEVSTEPSTRRDVVMLQEQLDRQLQQRQARETGLCPVRRELYTQCFDELIRQTTALYESSVAFGVRKALQAEQGKAHLEKRIAELEEEKKELEKQVSEEKAKCEAIERQETERREIEEKKHSEEVTFLKRTNQQLKAQLECIIAAKN
uniref:Axonemal dynein light intermediate polypeptide 1 n=1 Tax=Catharus ustulatus TaxID=91951 RepID=A0A8C3UDV3_CATUS